MCFLARKRFIGFVIQVLCKKHSFVWHPRTPTTHCFLLCNGFYLFFVAHVHCAGVQSSI